MIIFLINVKENTTLLYETHHCALVLSLNNLIKIKKKTDNKKRQNTQNDANTTKQQSFS